MIEPEIEKISPPKSEPTLRVGLFLEQDLRQQVVVASTSPGAQLKTVEGQELALEAAKYYTLEGQHESISKTDRSSSKKDLEGSKSSFGVITPLIGVRASSKKLTSSCTPIYIQPDKAAQLSPKTGFKIKQMLAGRGFHWRKEFEATYPGSLELRLVKHAGKDAVVLINHLKLEEYLPCVVSSEMGPECPEEFIKAQAVAARSWVTVFLRNKHPGLNGAPTIYDVCNDDDCQRYQGSTHLLHSVLDAVHSTTGEFLLDNEGYVVPAYYSKCCGGITETADSILGVRAVGLVERFDSDDGAIPDLSNTESLEGYLRGTDSRSLQAYCSARSVPKSDLSRYLGKVDKRGEYFRWSTKINCDSLIKNLSEKLAIKDLSKLKDILIRRRSVSGRVTQLELVFEKQNSDEHRLLIDNQYQIRRLLHPEFLFSSAFLISTVKDNLGNINSLTLDGAGWGHGVGLCQIGGLGMALKGKSYKEILGHYYPGTRIERCY